MWYFSINIFVLILAVREKQQQPIKKFRKHKSQVAKRSYFYIMGVYFWIDGLDKNKNIYIVILE